MQRHLTILIIAMMAINIGIHTFVAGWGIRGVSKGTSAQVSSGIVYNPTDVLFYGSLAQQAREGSMLFSDLYTTTPHRPLLLNPFFYVAGKLSAILSTSPIGVMNIMALLCIPVFMLSLEKIGVALGFDPRTRLVVQCLAMGGGGISWIRALAYKTGIGPALRVGWQGPDLFYFDLYPATAFTVYPLHAFSLTLLAVIGAIIVTSEDTTRPMGPKKHGLLAIAAALLAASRPYEPFLVLGSFSLLVILSHALSLPAELRRRRHQILLTLASAMVPFSIFSLWVSTQPVWNTFANDALNQQGNMDWFGGFLLLWMLAIPVILFELPVLIRRPSGFFMIWSIGSALVLLVFSSGLTKLCGGLTIPLSMMGGYGLKRIFDLCPGRQVLIATTLIFLAMASPLMAHVRFAKHPMIVPSDLLHAASAIRSDARIPVPTVLTDPETGEQLPGLAGMRVYCGHWSLTDRYSEKSAVLEEGGFASAPKIFRPLTPS
ncbi:MAG TPA: hypothetical protein VK968_03285, partial [Roseimicrobium sp.]|nr:hypothetical protein [Roseimicrobium sp.]